MSWHGVKMSILVRLIESLSNWVARISAVMLGLMTLLILVEIFLWNAFSKTTLIADEYCAYGLAAIIFLGAGYCLKEKGHIRITLVLGFLPKKLSRVITFVATGITTLFMGYLWWYLLKMVQSAIRYNSTSGTLTNTPLWIPQVVMLIGAACFLLQLFATTLKTYEAIGTGEEVV
jgi:TRAP-type C4-dicarboxylate transport system permease small subunit